MGDNKVKRQKLVKSKFNRKYKEMLYHKINLIIRLKAITGMIFLRALLKKI